MYSASPQMTNKSKSPSLGDCALPLGPGQTCPLRKTGTEIAAPVLDGHHHAPSQVWLKQSANGSMATCLLWHVGVANIVLHSSSVRSSELQPPASALIVEGEGVVVEGR
jgi:hypothetical protein